MRPRRGCSKPVYTKDSDVSDSNSYIDTEDDTEPGDNETHLTAPSSDVDDETFECLMDQDEDRDYPPEYYLGQEENFDESEFAEQDYSDGSCLLLDYIEERFFQYATSLFARRPFLKRADLQYRYCKYTHKDPEKTMKCISLSVVNSFFDWLLNQKHGKGGRRARGVRSANTLGTYWKVFRLVYERATGEKIKGTINRKIHRVSHGQATISSRSLTRYVNC